MARKTFLIAEAGVNHNGRLDLAVQLVKEARRAGADAVKFQTFRADRLASPRTARARYQGSGQQLEMLQGLELSEEAFVRLRDCAFQEGIEFLSTPFDEESAELVNRLGVSRFKISSGDLTDLPLLARIGSFKKPVILSTGMAEDGEIAEALQVLDGSGAQEVVLLHCLTSYPARDADLQLLRIPALRDRFQRPVGYSDHSRGSDSALAACALGACAVEKHLTLDRSLPGPDHAASAEPREFEDLVRRIRRLEGMLGSPERKFSEEELENRSAARMSITALRTIPRGGIIAPEDLAVLRPGTGIHPRHLEELIGREAAEVLSAAEEFAERNGAFLAVLYPNNDAGCQAVIREIEKRRGNPRMRIFPGLPRETFIGLLRSAETILGNSSAGIIEAVSLGVAAVNVGVRQAGRERNGNVVDGPPERKAILRALEAAPSDPKVRAAVASRINLYGDGTAAERTVRALERFLAEGHPSPAPLASEAR